MTSYTVARKLPGMGFNISDETGSRVITAKHHAGLKEERWDLADIRGHAVATLTLERMHSSPTYVISLPGEGPVTVSRDGAYGRTWSLNDPSGPLTVIGDTGAYDWKLVDAKGAVKATGERKVASAHQQYAVTAEGNPAVALCIALAIESERMHGREQAFGPLGPM